MSKFRCTGECGGLKEIKEFVKKESAKRGHTVICKKCMAVNNRSSYKKRKVDQNHYIIMEDPFSRYCGDI